MSLASSLNVGVSALRSYSEGLQVVSNNIANVNTVGYKASHAQYSDTFSNILKPLVPNENNTAVKIAPTQVGGGVQVESISPVFSQGTIQTTSSNSDLAIAGNGFFRVKNPQTGQNFVTRAGNFRVDADGYMVTQQGFRVQGSIGATTKVVYDAVNGSYDVKGPQDNVKVVIPSGMRTQAISATATANSAVLSGLSVTDAAVLKVGMPIAGGSFPVGTYVKTISGGVVTLSTKATTSGTSTYQASLLSVDSESLNLVFPPDFARPALVPGMVISGAGIEPGTTIQSVTGNLRAAIPASASSVTLTNVGAPSFATSSASSASTTLNFASAPTGWVVGQQVYGEGISDGTTITAIDPTTGAVTLSAPATVASGAAIRVLPGTVAATSALTNSAATLTFASAPAGWAVGQEVFGTGIPAGTRITNISGGTITLSNSVTVASGAQIRSGASTTTLQVSSLAGLGPGMVVSLSQGFSAGVKVRITSMNGSTNPPTITVNQAASSGLSGVSAVASGDKTLEAGTDSIRLSDVAGITVGMRVSGDGLPAGAYVGSITPDSTFGDYVVTLVDSAGVPKYISSSSYSAVELGFGDQTVVLNKRPNANTFDTSTLSVSTEYTPASRLGDLRVSFNEATDFTYYGTNGVALEGIPLEAARASGPRIRTFNVGTNGQVNVILSNGQTFNGGSVLIQTFKDPGALIREGDNLFSGIYTAGPYNGDWTPDNITSLTPSNGGLGSINGGALELSNVDIGEEFSTMIITQRAFQAGSRVISTADQMLEEAVNLKR
jgi:flagellar hook protein FlgE